MQRKNRTLLIWGDGAVGCGMAAALSFFGRTVLVGPRGSGRGSLTVTSRGFIRGEATVTRAEFGDRLKGDVSVIAVKAYHLSAMAEEVEAATGGPCICLCNGMGLEEQWGPTWKERVEPAVLIAGFSLTEPWRVETYPGGVTVSRDGYARELFRGGGLPVYETDGIRAARWGKWLVNSVINPLGALTGLRNDELLPAGLAALVNSLREELAQLIPEEVRDRALPIARRMLDLLLSESSNKCSMLQDLLAGRRTEIDFLTGLAADRLPLGGAAYAMVQLIRAKASPASV